MSSVSISNIESGMTLATSFVAYGRYDTQGGGFAPPSTTLITCSFQISGSTVSGSVSESPDSTGLAGYWQANFSGVATGTHGVLTASLNAPSPPPDAQASDLTVSDSSGVGPVVTVEIPAPPPPPEPKKKDKSPDRPDGVKVAAAAPKVKTSFTIGGAYAPAPAAIVLVSIRKGGRPCGDSKAHRLNGTTKRWEDDVQANVGELGDGYAVIAELQHAAKRKATAALLGVKIEI
jgi:hypothetical protein